MLILSSTESDEMPARELIMTDHTHAPDRTSLDELAKLFLKLGTIAFGGPAAHLAMMQDEFVRRRKWMSEAEFLDLLAVTNLIPGPNSTEMAIHIGHRRAGWRGLIVAGACFILPAFAIVLCLAWLYARYHSVPAAAGMLRGVQPVVIAVIAQALWRLAPAALKSSLLLAVGLSCVALNLLGVHELVLLAVAAALMAVKHLASTPQQAPPTTTRMNAIAPWIALAGPCAISGAPAVSFGLWPLFLAFMKIGSVLYGSGYVLVAFLRADFVERFGWLTETQLLDAVAVGQITPGPLFTTATFIGYLLGGPAGAAVSTVGIFLPAFVFVAAAAPFVPRLRRSPLASAILDGLNAGSLALMLSVTIQLARATLLDASAWAIALGSLLALPFGRINATWLMGLGVLVGLVFLR